MSTFMLKHDVPADMYVHISQRLFYVKENNSVLLNAIDFHQEEISFWSRNTKWFALTPLHNKIRIFSSAAIFKKLLLL
jgi:hypothetical protein